MKILIIEDADIHAEKIKMLLKKNNIMDAEIRRAKSLHKLNRLIRVEEGHYDIAFVDLNLEDGNSLEKFREIRKSTKEMIIISSMISRSVVDIAKKLKIKYVLQKPFSRIKFKKTMSKIKNKNKFMIKERIQL